MRTCARFTVSLAACLAIVWPAVRVSSAESDRPIGRAYANGPLVAADFKGKPPEQTPVNMGIEMVANSQCEVRYEYRAAIEQKGERWTARIASFKCTAVIVPEKCWNTSPNSRRVLDHEQGHFDLAEVAARRAQQHFAGLLRDGKATTSGKDKTSVQRALDREIKKAMDEIYESLDKAQKTYDEETRHGTAPVAQLRHRQGQRAELEKLNTAKTETAAKSKKPTSVADN